MEFKVERKVSFIETAYFEADSIEEAKEQLKGEEELEADYMENNCVRAMNGCIIFNENEFRKYR
jgi:hypothetical protein